MSTTPRLVLIYRLFMGAMFIVAGAIKLGDLQGFADSVASFQVLPAALNNFWVMGLPPFEIATGLMLILGWRLRVACLSILFLVALFSLAHAQALARHLVVDCGCFGSAHPGRLRDWLSLTRDLLLLAMACWLYRQFARSFEPQRHERC